jgi:CBS-domain-containing membrane protein
MDVHTTATQSYDQTLLARDIMVRRVFTLRTEQDVYEAVDLLLGRDDSGAPVVNDAFELVGVLSEKDCISALMRAFTERLPASTVADAMTREVRTIRPDTDLLTIAHLFKNHAFRRLPVVDGRRLVGQVRRRELLTALASVLREDPHYEAALLYLSAVDVERRVEFE